MVWSITQTDHRKLIRVATKSGFAAFWVDEMLLIEDTGEGSSISLSVRNTDRQRVITSTWPTEKVMEAILGAL